MKLEFPQTITSVQKLVEQIKEKLEKSISQDNFEFMSWLLLCHLTQKNKTQLLMQEQICLSSKQQKNLISWIKQITIKNKPIQYIIGFVPFCNAKILIQPPILIPRPETEEIACWIIEKLKKINLKKFRILDMCSGSGCIGIAIAKNFPNFEVTCVDINPQAIKLIKKNIKCNNVKNVKSIQSDIYKNIPKDKKYNLIISNPPYVTAKEWEKLENKIKKWEDPKALVAKNNGLSLFNKIIEKAKNHLLKTDFLRNEDSPSIILEIGHKQSSKVEQMLYEHGFKQIKTFKDITGKNRWVSAVF